MKFIKIPFFIAIILLIVLMPSLAFAQPGDPGCSPDDPACPIDSSVILLIAAAVGIAGKKYYDRKKTDAVTGI